MSPKVILSGAALTNAIEAYCKELDVATKSAVAQVSISQHFRELFRITLAMQEILASLQTRKLRPNPQSLLNTCQRIPVLILQGQASLAAVELRRLLELAFWMIYFTHHSREWDHFVGTRGSGYTRDASSPIGHAAHRDLSFYMDYCHEYMEIEPSKEAAKALRVLADVKNKVNAAVHAGQIAKTTVKQLPIEAASEPELKSVSGLYRKTAANLSVLLLAFSKRDFDRLSPSTRALFDWLVGPETRKRIRKGNFGLEVR